MDSSENEVRTPITFPREAVVDRTQLAAALGTDVDKITGLDLPCFYVGARARYVWGEVLDVLIERSHPDAQPHRHTFPRRKRAQ